MIAFNRPQLNQHLSLDVPSSENLKMAHPVNNDNSFNTTGFLNNNQNFLNEYENCYNTNTYSGNTFNYTTDDRSEILAWLSPLEPRVRHQDIVARRIGNIGAWLLETEEFKRWYSGNRKDASYHQTLFCDGDPGAGKSYIL